MVQIIDRGQFMGLTIYVYFVWLGVENKRLGVENIRLGIENKRLELERF